jgi:hypothetical protein
MPRKTIAEGLNKTVAFRVPGDAYEVIAAVMLRERRSESDVCRQLLARGIAAYKRDGLLFEPEDNGNGNNGARQIRRRR